MDQAFANLVEKCGVDLVAAAKFTSTNAARSLGIANRYGSIQVGKRADMAVLDSHYHCIATFVDGQMVYGA